ncbi:MAG: hypothetical protein SVW57_13190 [Thermodesulfobacteriota bacterium]|nr:hypothetical protein [Thermodesulfobacteriota bacterium]
MNWKNHKEYLGKQLTIDFYEKGLIKTWYRDKPLGWHLVSGLWSPLYIQLRPLSSFPELFKATFTAMGQMVHQEAQEVNHLIGIAMAGIPLAVGISIYLGMPVAYTRKLEGIQTMNDAKHLFAEYGEHAFIEGKITPGDRIGLVDDLVTKFSSKKIALEIIQHEVKRLNIGNVLVNHIFVAFDRGQKTEEESKKEGVHLHSLISFKDQGIEWLRERLHGIEYEVISHYLEFPEKFQDKAVQEELRRAAENDNPT